MMILAPTRIAWRATTTTKESQSFQKSPLAARIFGLAVGWTL
jgi:hypothetical protein